MSVKKYNLDNTLTKLMVSSSKMKIINGDRENLRARIESEDHIYQRKAGKNLKIKLLYPEHYIIDRKYPLVLHVQGSAWFKQNLSDHLLDFKEIVINGYIIAIVEYSSLPDAIFPSQVEDTKIAMRYLKNHEEELFIDFENVFLSGDSSGGHTALLSWATWNTDLLDSSNNPLPSIKACIDLYGIVDLETIANYDSLLFNRSVNSPDYLFLGRKHPFEYVDLAKKASVIHYLADNNNLAPLLIMHGNKDTLVPIEQSIQLFEYCQAQGIYAEFYCVNNADHGGNAFYCHEVVHTIIDFLKKHTVS